MKIKKVTWGHRKPGQSLGEMIVVLLILIGGLTGITPVALAHHLGGVSGSQVAGPITTLSATPMHGGTWAVGVTTAYIQFRPVSTVRLDQLAKEGFGADSTHSDVDTFWGMAYGLTNDLTVGMRIPYITRQGLDEADLDEDTGSVTHNKGNLRGIGDVALFGQYRFFNLPSRQIESALVAGLQIPTGATGQRGSAGKRFEADHQPGSGAWDPIIGLAFTKRWGAFSWDTSVLWTTTTKGAQRTDMGDVVSYNTALSYALGRKEERGESESSSGHGEKHVFHTSDQRSWLSVMGHGGDEEERHEHSVHWDLILELNGEWHQAQTIDGVRDRNNGGNTILLSPGIRSTINDRWAVSLSIGFPVIQNLHGIQHETRWRTLLSVGMGF